LPARKHVTFLLGAALLVGVGAFAFLPDPFIWAGAAWCLVLPVAALGAQSRSGRGLSLGLAILVLPTTAAEVLLTRRERRNLLPECSLQSVPPQGLVEGVHELLGHAPVPGRELRSIKRCSGEVVYDVEYTIDERGLRISPRSDAPAAALFFGCSYTFGEGVKDEESMPWQVGLRVAEELRVDNFGFSGYGPHQMLRALESGFVEERLLAPPVAVIYQMILLHLRRSAGMEPWDQDGPCYLLCADGGVEHRGRFRENRRSSPLGELLGRSALWRRLSGRTGAAERRLGVAIIDAARQEVARRYPEASFRVLLWDEERQKSDALEIALRERGIEVLRVSDILPGSRRDDRDYILGPFDMHPSAATHARIAEHLAGLLLAERRAPGR
jgi:hypothetical protein